MNQQLMGKSTRFEDSIQSKAGNTVAMFEADQMDSLYMSQMTSGQDENNQDGTQVTSLAEETTVLG